MIAEAGQIGSMTVAKLAWQATENIKLGEGVEALGGLAVIIHEHMENSRVDRQLRGRSGTRGTALSSYISLNHHLVKRWSDSILAENNQLYSLDDNVCRKVICLIAKLSKFVVKAQRLASSKGLKLAKTARTNLKKALVYSEILYTRNAIEF